MIIMNFREKGGDLSMTLCLIVCFNCHPSSVQLKFLTELMHFEHYSETDALSLNVLPL
jgi:hypothetical protein